VSKKNCLKLGCREPAPRGSAYCDEHRRARRQSIAKPSQYTSSYKNKLRGQTIARAHGRCEAPGCGNPIREVHHIVPVSKGGTDLPENLIALCDAHHAQAHGQRRRRPARRRA
jgi:5-methylcytosine-specific restriction protein A